MRRLDIAIGVIALAGLGIAAYLTYVHYAGLHPLCLASGGSKASNASKGGKVTGAGEVTARFAGIPQNGLTLGNPKAR